METLKSEQRKQLIQGLLKQSMLFDKYILTLAAGTFGLSLLFIREIYLKPETVYLLRNAWIFFGTSILITLISFLLSQKAYSKQLDLLDAKLTGNNVYSILTVVFNWLSMLMFTVGVVYLIIFSNLNLLS